MGEEELLSCNCGTRDKKVNPWLEYTCILHPLGRAIIEQSAKFKF